MDTGAMVDVVSIENKRKRKYNNPYSCSEQRKAYKRVYGKHYYLANREKILAKAQLGRKLVKQIQEACPPSKKRRITLEVSRHANDNRPAKKRRIDDRQETPRVEMPKRITHRAFKKCLKKYLPALPTQKLETKEDADAVTIPSKYFPPELRTMINEYAYDRELHAKCMAELEQNAKAIRLREMCVSLRGVCAFALEELCVKSGR